MVIKNEIYSIPTEFDRDVLKIKNKVVLIVRFFDDARKIGFTTVINYYV